MNMFQQHQQNPFMGGMLGSPSSRSPARNPATTRANPWTATVAGQGMQQQQQHTPEQLQFLLQMLENPAMQDQIRNQFAQNPQALVHMIAQQNPAMGAFFRANPAAAQQMVQSLLDPAQMRSMIQMQQAMQGQSGSGANMSGANMDTEMSGMSSTNDSPSTSPHAPHERLQGVLGQPGMDFGNLMQQLQGAGLDMNMNNTNAGAGGGMPMNMGSLFGAPPAGFGAPQQQQQQPPAVRYQRQLQSLYDMGFDDEQRNLDALLAVHGNLNRAVDMLVEGNVPTTTTTTNATSSSNSNTTAPAAPSSDSHSNHDSNPSVPPAPPGPPAEPKDAAEKKND